MATPHTRGLAAHSALEHLDAYCPGRAAAARARIPADSLQTILTCPSLGWVSVEHEHWVTDAIFAELGDDGIGYFRWLVARHLSKSTLFHPVLSRIARMFSVDPGTYLRMAPSAWSLAFRDYATPMLVDRDHHSASLELGECADAVFEHPNYVQSWCGVVAATLDLCGVTGEVSLARDESGRTVRFDLRW